MKATELRIGNIVLQNGEYFQVDAQTIAILEKSDVAEILPVELSNTTLKLLNFSNESLGLSIPLNNGELYFSKFGTLHYHVKSDEVSALQHIKYLHQLQNLYYSLSGVELDCANFLLAGR